MSERPAVTVVYLGDVARSQSVVQLLAAEGVQAVPVDSSEDLHRVLKQGQVDVLLIQQRLDGFLTGLEIVARMQSNLLNPTTILLGTVGPVQEEQLGKLGIDTVLDEDAAPEAIAAAVRGRLARDAVPSDGGPGEQLPIAYQARKYVGETEIVRPLPQLLTKLCQCLQDDRITLHELAADISLDPRVAAELLKITNNSAAGLARKVTSVRDAVMLLGLKRTIGTVLATGVLAAQAKLLKGIPAATRQWYQTRSVLIANTAAAFAERFEKGLSPESAHVLGLFQELGILVLATAEPKRYGRAIERTNTVGQLRLEFVEREEFGLTHADVSAALLERWEVPLPIVRLVLNHHQLDRTASHVEAEQQFLHVMRVAEAVANMADVPSPQRHHALTALFKRYPGRKAEDFEAAIRLGVEKTKQQSQLFSLPAPDEATMQSLLQQAGELSLDGPSPPERRDGSGAAPRPRLLVLDGDEAAVDSIGQMLAEDDVELVPCLQPDEALELAGGADVILCDYHLGHAGGPQFVRSLRARGCGVPVIMASQDRTRATIIECIEAGVSDYLVKPFTRDQLIEKLRKQTAAVGV